MQLMHVWRTPARRRRNAHGGGEESAPADFLLAPTPLTHAPNLHEMADDDEKKPAAEQLNLKVITQDGNEIFFKCKMTTPLQKLMTAFCNRHGVAQSSVRFLFDGARIDPNQTPQQLEMEDGDVIDCMLEQTGGAIFGLA